MDDAAESALIDAKHAEARAFPNEFCVDGLDDADEFASQWLAFYDRDFADLDVYPFVEIEFYERDGKTWSPIYVVRHGVDAHEVPSRDAALTKYRELLGSVQSCDCDSQTCSPELAAAPSAREQPARK